MCCASPPRTRPHIYFPLTLFSCTKMCRCTQNRVERASITWDLTNKTQTLHKHFLIRPRRRLEACEMTAERLFWFLLQREPPFQITARWIPAAARRLNPSGRGRASSPVADGRRTSAYGIRRVCIYSRGTTQRPIECLR